jgi:hypothetical protein
MQCLLLGFDSEAGLQREVLQKMFFGSKKQNKFEGGGLVLFQAVDEAIAAEKILKAVEFEVKLVAPPPALRKGCDLAVEFNIVEKAGVERVLAQKDTPFVEILPVKGAGELLDIVKIINFDNACMVKAGNMKLTFDKNSGVILNISGGGCPDIPFLHLSMVDKKITNVERPKDNGHTLCALMLDRAFVEALEIFRKEAN